MGDSFIDACDTIFFKNKQLSSISNAIIRIIGEQERFSISAEKYPIIIRIIEHIFRDIDQKKAPSQLSNLFLYFLTKSDIQISVDPYTFDYFYSIMSKIPNNYLFAPYIYQIVGMNIDFRKKIKNEECGVLLRKLFIKKLNDEIIGTSNIEEYSFKVLTNNLRKQMEYKSNENDFNKINDLIIENRNLPVIYKVIAINNHSKLPYPEKLKYLMDLISEAIDDEFLLLMIFTQISSLISLLLKETELLDNSMRKLITYDMKFESSILIQCAIVRTIFSSNVHLQRNRLISNEYFLFLKKVFNKGKIGLDIFCDNLSGVTIYHDDQRDDIISFIFNTFYVHINRLSNILIQILTNIKQNRKMILTVKSKFEELIEANKKITLFLRRTQGDQPFYQFQVSFNMNVSCHKYVLTFYTRFLIFIFELIDFSSEYTKKSKPVDFYHDFGIFCDICYNDIQNEMYGSVLRSKIMLYFNDYLNALFKYITKNAQVQVLTRILPVILKKSNFEVMQYLVDYLKKDFTIIPIFFESVVYCLCNSIDINDEVEIQFHNLHFITEKLQKQIHKSIFTDFSIQLIRKIVTKYIKKAFQYLRIYTFCSSLFGDIVSFVKLMKKAENTGKLHSNIDILGDFKKLITSVSIHQNSISEYGKFVCFFLHWNNDWIEDPLIQKHLLKTVDCNSKELTKILSQDFKDVKLNEGLELDYMICRLTEQLDKENDQKNELVDILSRYETKKIKPFFHTDKKLYVNLGNQEKCIEIEFRLLLESMKSCMNQTDQLKLFCYNELIKTILSDIIEINQMTIDHILIVKDIVVLLHDIGGDLFNAIHRDFGIFPSFFALLLIIDFQMNYNCPDEMSFVLCGESQVNFLLNSAELIISEMGIKSSETAEFLCTYVLNNANSCSYDFNLIYQFADSYVFSVAELDTSPSYHGLEKLYFPELEMLPNGVIVLIKIFKSNLPEAAQFLFDSVYPSMNKISCFIFAEILSSYNFSNSINSFYQSIFGEEKYKVLCDMVFRVYPTKLKPIKHLSYQLLTVYHDINFGKPEFILDKLKSSDLLNQMTICLGIKSNQLAKTLNKHTKQVIRCKDGTFTIEAFHSSYNIFPVLLANPRSVLLSLNSWITKEIEKSDIKTKEVMEYIMTYMEFICTTVIVNILIEFKIFHVFAKHLIEMNNNYHLGNDKMLLNFFNISIDHSVDFFQANEKLCEPFLESTFQCQEMKPIRHKLDPQKLNSPIKSIILIEMKQTSEAIEAFFNNDSLNPYLFRTILQTIVFNLNDGIYSFVHRLYYHFQYYRMISTEELKTLSNCKIVKMDFVKKNLQKDFIEFFIDIFNNIFLDEQNIKNFINSVLNIEEVESFIAYQLSKYNIIYNITETENIDMYEYIILKDCSFFSHSFHDYQIQFILENLKLERTVSEKDMNDIKKYLQNVINLHFSYILTFFKFIYNNRNINGFDNFFLQNQLDLIIIIREIREKLNETNIDDVIPIMYYICMIIPKKVDITQRLTMAVILLISDVLSFIFYHIKQDTIKSVFYQYGDMFAKSILKIFQYMPFYKLVLWDMYKTYIKENIKNLDIFEKKIFFGDMVSILPECVNLMGQGKKNQKHISDDFFNMIVTYVSQKHPIYWPIFLKVLVNLNWQYSYADNFKDLSLDLKPETLWFQYEFAELNHSGCEKFAIKYLMEDKSPNHEYWASVIVYALLSNKFELSSNLDFDLVGQFFKHRKFSLKYLEVQDKRLVQKFASSIEDLEKYNVETLDISLIPKDLVPKLAYHDFGFDLPEAFTPMRDLFKTNYANSYIVFNDCKWIYAEPSYKTTWDFNTYLDIWKPCKVNADTSIITQNISFGTTLAELYNETEKLIPKIDSSNIGLFSAVRSAKSGFNYLLSPFENPNWHVLYIQLMTKFGNNDITPHQIRLENAQEILNGYLSKDNSKEWLMNQLLTGRKIEYSSVKQLSKDNDDLIYLIAHITKDENLRTKILDKSPTIPYHWSNLFSCDIQENLIDEKYFYMIHPAFFLALGHKETQELHKCLSEVLQSQIFEDMLKNQRDEDKYLNRLIKKQQSWMKLMFFSSNETCLCHRYHLDPVSTPLCSNTDAKGIYLLVSIESTEQNFARVIIRLDNGETKRYILTPKYVMNPTVRILSYIVDKQLQKNVQSRLLNQNIKSVDTIKINDFHLMIDDMRPLYPFNLLKCDSNKPQVYPKPEKTQEYINWTRVFINRYSALSIIQLASQSPELNTIELMVNERNIEILSRSLFKNKSNKENRFLFHGKIMTYIPEATFKDDFITGAKMASISYINGFEEVSVYLHTLLKYDDYGISIMKETLKNMTIETEISNLIDYSKSSIGTERIYWV